MPHAQHARFYVVFTAPFDGHAHRHGCVLNTIDDEGYIRRDWRRQTNPDLKIVSIQKLPLDPHDAEPIVAELDKANREASGDDYRIPVGGEHTLTQRQVDAIRKQREAEEAGDGSGADAAPPIPGSTFGG